MNDPKTAAFAKAAQAIPEEQITGLLSDDDQAEEVEVSVTMQSESLKAKLIIKEEDEEEEDENDLMDINSDDEEESPVVVSGKLIFRSAFFLCVHRETKSFDMNSMNLITWNHQ